jgi:hypothetical protein
LTVKRRQPGHKGWGGEHAREAAAGEEELKKKIEGERMG